MAAASATVLQKGQAMVFGDPVFADPTLADLARAKGSAAAMSECFARYGAQAPQRLRGRFAVAVRDERGRTLLAVDRFSVETLCFRVEGDTLAFAPRADAVATGLELDSQAIFDYLYFHVIPAPRTIFRGVQRLPGGYYALYERDRLTMAPWWQPQFVEHGGSSLRDLRSEFRTLLRQAVAREVVDGTTGCFLSGGTDSSTVAGLLTQITGKPAPTFSIGFSVQGYDEMAFARIASSHFGTDHHEYYVTPDDVVASIPAVAASYDQPFGNSSVLPTYYCAKIAREHGVTKILGGDGGDELFGGNSRYAKQRIFDWYMRVPATLREGVLNRLWGEGGRPSRLPVLRKASSYVRQAVVPMPDRMQMYNLLERLGIGEVLEPSTLASIDAGEPLAQQRAVWAMSEGKSLINRMLAFDWRYTLADNDLPKVKGAVGLAGLATGFPLLDDDLTDFSLKLAPDLKLRGLKLRWFFKEALRDFLPREIIVKRKHGFGLPFGTWANEDAGLRALALDSIASLRERGIVRREFLDKLVRSYLPQHPGYYGEMLWILMMLEQWIAHAQSRVKLQRSISSREQPLRAAGSAP